MTKGSFYWHFASRDDLFQAMLESWTEHATQRVIEIVENDNTQAIEKIRRLTQISSNSAIDDFGGALELAVRVWASREPAVRRKVAEVDRQRVEYLQRLYGEVGSSVDAELLASLHYAFSTGLRLIFSHPQDKKPHLRDAVLERILLRLTRK